MKERKTKSGAKPGVKPGAKPEAKPGAKSEAKSGAKPEAKAEYIGVFDVVGGLGRVIPDARGDIRKITVLRGNEGGAKQGDRVVVALAPEKSYRNLLARTMADRVGKVTEVLGAGGDLAVAENALIRRLQLRREFSEEQLTAAQNLNQPVGEKEREGRRDLRQELVVTIDGEDTRDVDDAISLSKKGNRWVLGVHIADVAHYVREGSIVDQEAFARGTSIYFPDHVLPMLPPDLSNGICSLNQGEDRLAVSCLMTLNARGVVVDYEVCHSVVRVTEHLNYPQVQGYLNRHNWSTKDALAGKGGKGKAKDDGERQSKRVGDNKGADRGKEDSGSDNRSFFRDEAVGPMMIDMAKLCLILRKNRLERGALDFDLPECKIEPGTDGNAGELKRKKRMLSEMLIEEMMIIANETIAMYLREKKIPFPYRVHEKPGYDKLYSLQNLLDNLGISSRTAREEAGRGKGKGQNRSQAKDKRKNRDTGKGQNSTHGKGTGVRFGSYQQLIAEAKGKPTEAIVSMLLLRSMNHAYYSAENHGHFGLASDCYCHFTSPIRRYPDLMVHRMLLKALSGKQEKNTDDRVRKEKVEEQCREASTLERIAEDAERKVDSLWKADYMNRFIGAEFDGVITGVTEYGFYVGLENTAEGMVHVSRLEGYYEFLEENMMLTSRQNPVSYRLGESIRVMLESVDVGAGHINFKPAEKLQPLKEKNSLPIHRKAP